MFSFLWCAGFCSVLTLFFSCFQQLPGGNKVNDTSPQSLALKGRGWLGCSSVLAKAPKSEVWLPKMEEKEVEDPRSSGQSWKSNDLQGFYLWLRCMWKEMNDVQFLGWAEVIFFSQIRARIRIYGSQISETNVDRTSEVWEGAGSICFVGISCVPIPGVVLHGFAFYRFNRENKTMAKVQRPRPAGSQQVPKPTRSRRKFPVNCRKAYDEPIGRPKVR